MQYQPKHRRPGKHDRSRFGEPSNAECRFWRPIGPQFGEAVGSRGGVHVIPCPKHHPRQYPVVARHRKETADV